MNLPLRVIKLGGSLFEFPSLPTALTDWFERDSPRRGSRDVIVAGGGRLADVVRDADGRFDLGASNSHWMCIRLLDTTAQMLARILTATQIVHEFDDLCRSTRAAGPGRWIAVPEDFLRNHEPTLAGQRLPHDWNTTTDAIAARLATALDADELVLLKSCELAPHANWHDAAASGLVDNAFPASIGPYTVRWVNLRSV